MSAQRTLGLSAGLIVLASALAFLATPVAADAKLNMIADGMRVLNPDDLNHGRLRPATSELRIEYSFKVQVPAATVCPVASIDIQFEKDTNADWKSDVLLSLSQDHTSFSPAQANATEAETYGPFKTVLTIKTTRNVPAFQSAEYGVSAQAFSLGSAGQCTVEDSVKVRQPYSLSNDYFPLMEYVPAKYLMKSGPNKEITFVVHATNLGNAQTRVTSEIKDRASIKLPAVVPPAPVTLDSIPELGDQARNGRDILVSVRTPSPNGYTNSLYTFVVLFEAVSATPTAGVEPERQQLTLTVQVQGVYVPGFEPSGLLVALGLTVFMVGATRRRRA